MKRLARTARIGGVVCALVHLMSAPSGPAVWVASSLQRVDGTAERGLEQEIHLQAARGEVESFQVALRSPQGVVRCADASVSNLRSQGGAIIGADNITLYREHAVYVAQGSSFYGGSNPPLGPGWYDDGLIPFRDPSTGRRPRGGDLQAVPFEIAAGHNQLIWIDISVPRDAAAGNYLGTVTIACDQPVARVGIALQVWRFALPLRPSLKSSFGVWISHDLRSQEELLRHKVAPNVVEAANEAVLSRQFGLGLTGLGFWSGANFENCYMSEAPSVRRIREEARKHQRDVLLYNYTADEIGDCPNLYEPIKEWARRLHQAHIRNLVTVKPMPELLDDGTGMHSAVDIWVLLPVMFEGTGPALAAARARGDEIWSYNGLAQDGYSPKWLIDYAPINFRIQPGFLSQGLGLTGILYWRVDAWTARPWEDVNATGIYGAYNAPGEGMLVYPGQAVGVSGVVPSMRLKWIRDGVEDYEYVELLKQCGRGEWGRELTHRVARDWKDWTKDPQTLERVRSQLGVELDRLAGR